MIDMLLPYQEAAKSEPGAVHSQEFTLLFKLRINLIDPEGYGAPCSAQRADAAAWRRCRRLALLLALLRLAHV
jgi:hypothetical protein